MKGPGASIQPIGDHEDPVLQLMIKHQLPLNRAEWLKLSYPDGLPEWGAEREVPKIFQKRD